MPARQPLDAQEEQLWRSCARLIALLPRVLDADLAAATGLSLTDYTTLMQLSEAPGRRLRMSELAERADLSPSRMTRLVAELEALDLVQRSADPTDARATIAVLTAAGGRRLRAAYPAHLASVRAHVLDELTAEEVALAGPLLRRLAERLGMAGCSRPRLPAH